WIHPDDLGVLRFDFEAHLDRDPVTQEIRVRHRDGGWVLLRQMAQVVRSGDRLLLRGVSLDISETLRARESVDQYADILERMHDGVAVIVGGPPTGDSDPTDWRAVHWNRSLAGMFGL